MRRLLLSVFAVFIVAGTACAEDVVPSGEARSENASLTEAPKEYSFPVSKWYAGGTVGYAMLEGWDSYPVTDYYFSKGYYLRDSSVEDYVLHEWNMYLGYRYEEHVDFEMGFSKSGSSVRKDYASWSDERIRSIRWLRSQALYAAALFRPASRASRAGFYFKAGVHASRFESEKAVSGTPANLNALAAGDTMEYDGRHQGNGLLLGFGFDFRIGNGGAIRLEFNHYGRLGGTSYNKRGLNVGGHINF